MTKVGKILPDIYEIGIQVLVVMGFLSLKLLLDGNMGMVNEVDVLPLANLNLKLCVIGFALKH